MIVINSEKCCLENVNVSYGRYKVVRRGKSIKGIGLYICFKYDISSVGIEMTYDLRDIKILKVNSTIDITDYVSDITFEDENGWLSLILGDFVCLLTKREKDLVNIELKYKGEECSINFDIYINEDVKIEYKDL